MCAADDAFDKSETPDETIEYDLDVEDVIAPEGAQLSVGDKAPELAFRLAIGDVELKLSNLLTSGPVLLNFIKGTWCPFCQKHLKNLKSWTNTLSGKKVAILGVTNDSTTMIRAWLRSHPIDFMFGAVERPEYFKAWGVAIDSQAFPRPATFLIDQDHTIRFVHNETRGKKFEALKSKV